MFLKKSLKSLFKRKILPHITKKYSNIKIDNNVENLIYADIYSGLGWLNYNLKRSLCIENQYDKDEIELAENEVIQSIGEIKYNINQIEKMLKILKKE